jgi:hypothetical protein
MTNKVTKAIKTQGDVLFRLVPANRAKGEAVKPTNGRIIFALGEVTGHHHSCPEGTGTQLLDRETGYRYFTIDELIGEAPVEHQEHDTFPLENVPGMVWEIRPQWEYQRDAEPRQVAD